MSITINGAGTISGLVPGGLPDSSIVTDDLASGAVTFPKLGTDEQAGLAKAWVNFNGTGTVAIRASYNVSSITDNGVGDYTVNFTAALVDANYALCGNTTHKDNFSSNTSVVAIRDSYTPATNSVRISVNTNNETTGFYTDNAYVFIAIFR
jgi:hypothetical protein